jgi:hypothetical protein
MEIVFVPGVIFDSFTNVMDVVRVLLVFGEVMFVAILCRNNEILKTTRLGRCIKNEFPIAGYITRTA